MAAASSCLLRTMFMYYPLPEPYRYIYVQKHDSMRTVHPENSLDRTAYTMGGALVVTRPLLHPLVTMVGMSAKYSSAQANPQPESTMRELLSCQLYK